MPMTNDTDIIALRQPETVDDPLTEIARDGARRMLAAALRAEADAFVTQHAQEVLPDGRQRVVRHGHGPERSIQTGIGALDMRRPKVRDRAAGPADRKMRFSSAILPKRARRSKSLDALLPGFYLRGISTGDFGEALSAILGTDAPNLSPSVISRLTGEWQQDYERWQHRDLSARRYVWRTASTSRPGWSRRPSAYWSFSGPRPRAGRNWLASMSASGRAPRAPSRQITSQSPVGQRDASCLSTSRPAASRCLRRLLSVTGHGILQGT